MTTGLAVRGITATAPTPTRAQLGRRSVSKSSALSLRFLGGVVTVVVGLHAMNRAEAPLHVALLIASGRGEPGAEEEGKLASEPSAAAEDAKGFLDMTRTYAIVVEEKAVII